LWYGICGMVFVVWYLWYGICGMVFVVWYFNLMRTKEGETENAIRY